MDEFFQLSGQAGGSLLAPTKSMAQCLRKLVSGDVAEGGDQGRLPVYVQRCQNLL